LGALADVEEISDTLDLNMT